MDALSRTWLSLDGLSVGDAFGERFFGEPDEVVQRISRRDLPEAPWSYTDDTEMALSIVELLQERGSALGDRDTTCTIVGGILAPRVGRDGIPQGWLQSREQIPVGPEVSA